MDIVLNSKFFANLSVEQLGEKAVSLGYDGIDICIRPGHPIHAENAISALSKAVKIWQSQNLVCPLASAEVTLTDPKSPDAEKLYAACSEANILRIKIGFWKFNPGDNYRQVLDAARADLEGFVSLGQKHGIQTCYQTHSGPCIGSNCAGLMHLIKDFDPRHVGAYPDLGHLVLDGEDYEMGLSMIREYLSVVGIKDAYYAPLPEEHAQRYTPCFVKVGDGCVNWERALGVLKKLEFDGPLTVHTEYCFDESIIRRVGYAETRPPNLERFAKADAAYLKQVLSMLPGSER